MPLRDLSAIFQATTHQLPLLRLAFHLQGPTETPFEGGTFELTINVPEQYPLVPPAVRFKTKIFHPNFHFRVRRVNRGRCCSSWPGCEEHIAGSWFIVGVLQHLLCESVKQ